MIGDYQREPVPYYAFKINAQVSATGPDRAAVVIAVRLHGHSFVITPRHLAARSTASLPHTRQESCPEAPGRGHPRQRDQDLSKPSSLAAS